MILYNLFPLLAGPFSRWDEHFARAAALGFNWVFVNPIQRPGASGSLYSISDYFQINPALLDRGSKAAPDDQAREMIAQALKQRGAKPVQASSARKAFDLLKQEPYDLVISDIGMPDIDGYAFIRKLRSMKSRVSKVPAIALTAYADEENRKLTLEAGFNTHIPKPIAR